MSLEVLNNYLADLQSVDGSYDPRGREDIGASLKSDWEWFQMATPHGSRAWIWQLRRVMQNEASGLIDLNNNGVDDRFEGALTKRKRKHKRYFPYSR